MAGRAIRIAASQRITTDSRGRGKGRHSMARGGGCPHVMLPLPESTNNLKLGWDCTVRDGDHPTRWGHEPSSKDDWMGRPC